MLKYAVAILVVILFGSYYYLRMNNPMPEAQQPAPVESSTVTVTPIEHATGILSWNGTSIYFDPVGASSSFAGKPPADIVLVTDIHGDHFSTSTLATVVGDAAFIVPQAVYDELPAELQTKARVLTNTQSTTTDGFAITALPMYNLPDSENADFHTKGRGNGYLLEKDGIRVYIAGDTAGTPEMRALTDVDIAFVPMNMPYTMTVEEAADAVLAFKPRTVYPYHYRGPDGLSDVEKFRDLVTAGDPNINVVLAPWYPAQ